jgi:hypothetical protein
MEPTVIEQCKLYTMVKSRYGGGYPKYSKIDPFVHDIAYPKPRLRLPVLLQSGKSVSQVALRTTAVNIH